MGGQGGCGESVPVGRVGRACGGRGVGRPWLDLEQRLLGRNSLGDALDLDVGDLGGEAGDGFLDGPAHGLGGGRAAVAAAAQPQPQGGPFGGVRVESGDLDVPGVGAEVGADLVEGLPDPGHGVVGVQVVQDQQVPDEFVGGEHGERVGAGRGGAQQPYGAGEALAVELDDAAHEFVGGLAGAWSRLASQSVQQFTDVCAGVGSRHGGPLSEVRAPGGGFSRPPVRSARSAYGSARWSGRRRRTCAHRTAGRGRSCGRPA
ncbi:hypothetical protein GA0115255_105834 [Streptomyces sp. Ncost-T6T-2b]|nr:hypothetical protein GA0115255_105834 [Streptomyces sp. Ncost-T6T-2b]